MGRENNPKAFVINLVTINVDFHGCISLNLGRAEVDRNGRKQLQSEEAHKHLTASFYFPAVLLHAFILNDLKTEMFIHANTIDFFKICLNRRLSKSAKSRDRQRRSSQCWFTPHSLQQAGQGQGKANTKEAHLNLPHGWQGRKQMGHLLLLSQVHCQGAGSETEHLVLQLIL